MFLNLLRGRHAGLGRSSAAVGSAAVLLTYFMAAGASPAAVAASSPTSYAPTPATIHAINSTSTFPFKGIPASTKNTFALASGERVQGDAGGDDGSPIFGTGLGAPAALGLSKVSGNPQVTASYDGLSNTWNDSLNGFELTPPDQGLCSGYDPTLAGDPKVVFEVINDVGEEIYPNGTLARPVFSLAQLFDDPYAEGDVRCFYDTDTKAFYFSEIGASLSIGAYITDVGVLNKQGRYTVYQVDTSLGGVEFPDQPTLGFDKNNIYLSTNEFNNYTNNYDGSVIFAISKSQLNQEVASPNGVYFGPLSFEGGPVLSTAPTINTQANDEYLLNSNPYDASGNNLASSNTLGLWEVTGGMWIDSGRYDRVGLQSSILNTETYGFPVDAQSTGTGAVNSNGITSEAALNPDDDRMLQVIGTGNGGDERLYAALTTDITPAGDSSVRDGAAWFQIRPTFKTPVENQGYVSVAGEYLIYPAIYPTSQGNTMAFTITSPSINPSAGYSVTDNKGNFSTVNTIATGYGAHYSFSDYFYAEARWGDYSAAALDPNGKTVWMATEYIPPTSEWGTADNWGTYIWSVH